MKQFKSYRREISDVFIIKISLVTGNMDICFGNLASNGTD